MRQLSCVLFAAALCAPVSAQASLSCSSPCTGFNTLSQTGSFYDVYVDCESGAYAAATGASHPATVSSLFPQNVIYGGSFGSPGTSTLGLYLYTTDEHFSTGNELTAINVTPQGSCTFDPPDTPSEVGSLGIETEWLVTDSFGSQYIWRHEVVTFGDTEANAGARLTQSVEGTSSAPFETNVGVRWQIDYQSGNDDGPTYAHVTCDPFSTSVATATEQDFSSADLIDFFQMINNDGFQPIIENYTSTTGLGGFPNTETPDRLVYGYWPSLVDASWNYVSAPANVDSDSAVMYYFGATEANALVAPVGTSVSRSVVLFNAVNSDDCGDFEPKDTGPDIVDTADTDPPIEPEDPPPYYAGGCASCNTSGSAPSSALLLLALAVPMVRRRAMGENS